MARLALALQCGLMGVAAASTDEVVSVPGEAMSAPEELAIEPLRISMEFEGVALKNVLKSFSQQSGINIIAVAEVGERPVTLYLEDVAILDALDQVLAAGGLTYERPPGSDIYVVKPIEPDGAAPKLVTRVYRLRYARVSRSVLARAAAAFGARTPFEASLDPAAGAGGAGSADVGIDLVIGHLLTEQGQVVVDGRTNSLMITDVAENFPRLEAALAALDIRTPQIMVDAEIIETTLSKLKDLGIEWGSGSEGDFLFYRGGFRASNFPLNLFPGRQHVVTTELKEGVFGFTGTVTQPGQIGLAGVDASRFQAVLQALEIDTDTKILARPKVLTLDNESAVIRLVTDEAIGFETSQASTGTTPGSKPERTTTGIVLVVTPQVNEGDHITMIVEPSVSKTVKSKIEPPTNQSTPRDPKTRSARALVRVRSGDTLVVGGLIDRNEEEVLRRVPVLSSIPFLGAAFRNTEITNSASELIVFVTPRILADAPEATQVASAQPPPLGAREQDAGPSRQALIEETLNRLEEPSR